jgi:hypothetical protein
MVWEGIKEEQHRKRRKYKRKKNRYLIMLLFLLPFPAIAQSGFAFDCFLKMEGSDQIAKQAIEVQIDSQYIQLQTADTTIKHRIISERYNPYMYQTEYKLSCGGKMRIDFFWDTTVKSFFFKCPGTHWYSGRNFEEAVLNNEYE